MNSFIHVDNSTCFMLYMRSAYLVIGLFVPFAVTRYLNLYVKLLTCYASIQARNLKADIVGYDCHICFQSDKLQDM